MKEVQTHVTDVTVPIAQLHNLSINSFASDLSLRPSNSKGRIVISDAFNSALEPSPITPRGVDTPYDIVAGTIRAVVRASDRHEAKEIVVASSLGLGNTGEEHSSILTTIAKFKLTSGDIFHRYPVLLESNKAYHSILASGRS